MANNESRQQGDAPRRVAAGTSLGEAAKASGLRGVLAAVVDGTPVDLAGSLERDADVSFLVFDDPAGRDIFWHSTSHLLAQAVTRLYPGARYTIGPAVENGFYYDFDLAETLDPEALAKIEDEMRKIVAENLPVRRRELTRQAAIDIFRERGNPYKVEILEELPADAVITVYEQGEFTDLCRGPHVQATGRLAAVKLTAVAGAYWRGDAKNKMLQRIYGISFPDKKALEAHLARLEEAKLRDHRKIGKEMDLFSFQDEGPGFPFWHPKGTELYNQLTDYIRGENRRRGYAEIKTPPLLDDTLWHKSGHWDNFKENMYFTEIDGKSFAVKPMNCPGGLLVYKNQPHSYRELPIRNAELGLVHRHELSGVLHGLFRVRSFTQDDAHIFCSPAQLKDEIRDVINYTLDVYRDFGFSEINVFVATRPAKSIGSDEDWALATEGLKDALAELGIAYGLKEGEGAFYGPKIEFNIRDCLGRNWQCGTAQVDFSMPSRFGAVYRDSDGKDHVPVMVHRAIFGSLERFIGIVTEHFAGKYPPWLAPVQVAVLSVAGAFAGYAREVADALAKAGLRVETDVSDDKLGNKIRLARNSRVPYIFILGEQEQANQAVSFKTYRDENVNGLPLTAAIGRIARVVAERRLETAIDI